MATKRLARHNVVAVFGTFDDAERALGALQEEGLTAAELSLLGPEHVMRPGTGTPKESPTRSSGGVGKGAVAGITTGAATGGALGATGGAVAAAIPGVGWAVGTAVGLGALAGAVAGQIAGGLLGAEAGGRKAMMLEQTFHPLLTRVERGDVLLGVHSDDRSRIEEAEDVLGTLAADEVVRVDADETFDPPGDISAVADRTIPSSHPDQPGGEVGRDVVPTEDGRTVGMEERPDGRD